LFVWPDFTQNQAGVAIAFFNLQLWMGQVPLKSWRKEKNAKVDKLMEYARICRIYNVIKPYVEATL